MDLVITTDDVQLHNLTADAPLGKSDHIMICFDYVCSMGIPTSSGRKYLYEKGDYNQFNRELLDLDWNVMFNGLTTEEMWHHFHSIYCKLVDKYIPSVIPKANNSPQWMNKSLKNIINLKRKAWARYKRTLHPLDYSNYALRRNECTAAVRRAKYEFENNLVRLILNVFGNILLVNPKLNMLWVDC